MPCQVSWQLVVMKSWGSTHGRGAAVISDSDGGALPGTTSAARAGAVLETTPRRSAAHTPSFAMRGTFPAKIELWRAWLSNGRRASDKDGSCDARCRKCHGVAEPAHRSRRV